MHNGELYQTLMCSNGKDFDELLRLTRKRAPSIPLWGWIPYPNCALQKWKEISSSLA